MDMLRLRMDMLRLLSSWILVWKTWNIVGFVLLSLLLQFILFFAAPLRKKTTTWAVVGLIWSSYQLVDTAINHALSSLVSIAQIEEGSNRTEKGDLYTLWAVVLLLHFGGPDTITALSMEDNSLWRRSWLILAAQLIATVNVVLSSPPKYLPSRPSVLVPSLLILLAGLVKSYEKIQCLKKASLGGFGWSLVRRKPNPGPDYAAIVEEHNFYKKAGIPVEFVEIKEPVVVPLAAATNTSKTSEELNDAQLVKQAYLFYTKFEGTYVDRVFCCHDRIESRDLFLRLSAQAAFTIVETEMKFAFEAFYTKAHLFVDPRWETAHFVSLVFESAALLLWLRYGRHLFQPADALVTTSLLVGAVIIDIVAFVRLYLSDWKIAQSPTKAPLLFRPFLYMRRLIRWGEYCVQDTPWLHKLMRVLFRHWSQSISQLNLIHYCVVERPDWRNMLYKSLGVKDMMDGWKCVSDRCLTNNLREFLFEELKHKSSTAAHLDTWEDVNSSRGSWTLRYNASGELDPATFEPWISDVEYDESLLMWHIATEICYETEEKPMDREEQEHRIFSKVLSDYILYLSVWQPELMSEMAPMAEVIFSDTCKEARQLVHRVMASGLPNAKCKARQEEVHKEACRRIKQVMIDNIPPGYIKGDENNSVLFEASALAMKLSRVKRKPWKLISQIWVELLCYAAAHSPGSAHAMLLSKGGQLVTLVRLLMLHFGLSNRFRKAKYIPRSELLVHM